MKKLLIGVTLLSISLFALGGCSTVKPKGLTPNQQANIQTQQYVNQKMTPVMDSIDHSLKNLVLLDRGDEGSRKSSPLGSTVAGASGPDQAPIAMSKEAAPQTSLGKQQAEQAHEKRVAHMRALLASEINLHWDGDVSGVLSHLADKLHVAYYASGTPHKSTSIHLREYHKTVQEVLSDISKKVEGQAHVVVNLDDQSITLDYNQE